MISLPASVGEREEGEKEEERRQWGEGENQEICMHIGRVRNLKTVRSGQ